MLGDSTIRTESSRWQRAYSDSRLARRRASTHKRKLSQLGCFSLPRTARILDVPCGTGEALRILHQAGFTDLTGSDITADPKLAAEKWARIDCADAVSLPYDSGSFDAVISMHSLHHLGGAVRIGRAFDEWLRVIRPGGRLMIIDHYDSLQLRAAFWGLQRPWLTWPTHGLRTLREQLEEERSYLYDYLDTWQAVSVLLSGLPCDVDLQHRGLFFFYWAGRKRVTAASQ